MRRFARSSILPPPQMEGVVHLSGTTLRFTFAGLPGQCYQVEWMEDLDDATWVPLGPLVIGDGSSVVVTDDLGGRAQRFYCLVVLP
jgi:hypothetical protein